VRELPVLAARVVGLHQQDSVNSSIILVILVADAVRIVVPDMVKNQERGRYERVRKRFG
jgi:hypothetical protein